MESKETHIVSEMKNDKVKFVIQTYPDLQPFLEMTVNVLEGLYEYKNVQAVSISKKK